jgi:hypothetical protein
VLVYICTPVYRYIYRQGSTMMNSWDKQGEGHNNLAHYYCLHVAILWHFTGQFINCKQQLHCYLSNIIFFDGFGERQKWTIHKEFDLWQLPSQSSWLQRHINSSQIIPSRRSSTINRKQQASLWKAPVLLGQMLSGQHWYPVIVDGWWPACTYHLARPATAPSTTSN